MSYLINKYKGVYRLKAPLTQDNQFQRKLDGTYEDMDVYIDCQYNNKIFYYGRGILQAYIPSIGRGRNILRAINEIDSSIIFDIEETDEEVLFKFSAENDYKIIPLLKPKTSAANRSPFSSKNIPIAEYTIPESDLAMYKEITNGMSISDGSGLKLNKLNKEFFKSLTNKRYTIENLNADMAKKMLKGKEYIHSIGKWNDYIKFLKKNW